MVDGIKRFGTLSASDSSPYEQFIEHIKQAYKTFAKKMANNNGKGRRDAEE